MKYSKAVKVTKVKPPYHYELFQNIYLPHEKKFYLSLEFDKHVLFIWNKLEAATGAVL